jgi:hypothetical protein
VANGWEVAATCVQPASAVRGLAPPLKTLRPDGGRRIANAAWLARLEDMAVEQAE